ncbi:UbiA family prenyltransferase [Chitinophaga polysaccharea]|uniref:UbiA family prenyltransferase n=1 Tax=Chitinophaga polysaccharea TaxID=1293035 RepID=UPI001159511B|nr:UbiA family prenyltransferase [Chitinophaga polysaccharea]
MLPFHLVNSFIYAILYILTFCMLNQVNSVEEDSVNKPYRPLPSGLLTRRQTWIRIIVYSTLFLGFAAALNIFWISVAWQAVTYFLNIFGGSNHWITKNLVGMTIGTFLLLAAQWEIASPGEGVEMNVILYWSLISLWAGFALPIQDFRDIDGDRQMGRKTLPLAIGDNTGRNMMVVEYLFLLPFLFMAAMLSQKSFWILVTDPLDLSILIIQILVHWVIAFRLWFFRSPKQDDKTYHLYVYLFCAGVPAICYM